MRRRIVILSVLMLVLALTRVPGAVEWSNFSPFYAIVFCAGVFFRGRWGWALPLGLLLLTDLLLTLHYQRQSPGENYWGGVALLYMLGNYAAYAGIYFLGRWLGRGHRSFTGLLGGGVLGALLFYLVTNTVSWLLNPFHHPEYTRDLAGWIIALTKGAGGYPETWTFFRNTLLSGGLFTALFVVAARVSEPEPEPVPEDETAPEPPAPAEPEKTA